MPWKPKQHRPSHAPLARRQRDANRANSCQRGYDAQWRKARLQWLAEHPLCEECERQGLTTVATVVDHRVPHRGDAELFWDSAHNWQSLCVYHHNRKTAKGE